MDSDHFDPWPSRKAIGFHRTVTLLEKERSSINLGASMVEYRGGSLPNLGFIRKRPALENTALKIASKSLFTPRKPRLASFDVQGKGLSHGRTLTAGGAFVGVVICRHPHAANRGCHVFLVTAAITIHTITSTWRAGYPLRERLQVTSAYSQLNIVKSLLKLRKASGWLACLPLNFIGTAMAFFTAANINAHEPNKMIARIC